MAAHRNPVKRNLRPPTMDDVAAKAGVSRALVSLVMRKAPNVSDERRSLVLAAATELGYRPNAMARSLASNHSRTVGVLINDLHNPYFAEIADGIEHIARSKGYRVLLSTGGRHRTREEEALESFLESRVDGVILLSSLLAVGKIVQAAQVAPIVVVSRAVAGPGIDTIVNDDDFGEQLAVTHLIELGHRRIAHIDGGTDPSAEPRRRGYERAMRSSGLEPRVIRGDFSENGGAVAARRLLDLANRPTAVVAANDLAAAGAIECFEDAGLAVPTDVSVVGYDNSFVARLRQIDLTTVNQPRDDMGRLAMRTLLERVEQGRTDPARHVTTPTLIVRSTTGPAPIIALP